MTYEERLEVFERYREFAEGHSINTMAWSTKSQAIGCGQRALWEVAKTPSTTGTINLGILRKAIRLEQIGEQYSLDTKWKQTRFIRAKKGAPINDGWPEAMTQSDNFVQISEHGLPSIGRRKLSEIIPDDMSSCDSKIIKLRGLGYTYEEIGNMVGKSFQHVRYLSKKLVADFPHKKELA